MIRCAHAQMPTLAHAEFVRSPVAVWGLLRKDLMMEADVKLG